MADLTSEHGFTLSELVKSVADELRNISPPTTGAVMQFAECEIELNVKALYKAGGKGGFWVFAEVSGEASREAGHIIRLKFSSSKKKPVQANILPVNIDDTLTIADFPEKKIPKNRTQSENG